MIEGYIITYCKEQIAAACHALNATFQGVKALFQYGETTVIDYANNEEKELMLEIRFKNATLNCLFDQNNLCDGVFLFLDDSSDLVHLLVQVCDLYLQLQKF